MGKKSKAQIEIEYLAARFLLGVFGLLPRNVSIALGRGVGKLVYHLIGDLRRTGRRNLEMALSELSEKERDEILRGCFSNLGRSLGMFPHLKKLSLEELNEMIHVEGREHFETARASGRGTLLITGHLGAWEMLPIAAVLNDFPINILVRRLDNPKIEKLADEVRTLYGNHTLDKRSSTRDMVRLLNEGEMIGVLIDVNADLREGVFVDFFGIPACTTVGIASLALRTNANVLPVFVVWDKTLGKYLLKVDAPIDFTPSGDKEKDRIELTARMTKAIESCIRKYPDQWLWIHKRWKTRPKDKPDLYKKAETRP
jgi:KDO2-lipid IV(A) lauroyltransferase